MDHELQEVINFVSDTPPFDGLGKDELEQLVCAITIRYVRKGLSLPPKDESQRRMYLIRKGALSLFSKDGNLLGMLGEGDICTVFCTQEHQDTFNVKTKEDTLLYTIPCDQLTDLMQTHPKVLSFFMQSASERLKERVVSMSEDAIVTSTLMNTAVDDLYNAPAITIDAASSIQQAAQKMSDHGYSSLLVTQDKQLAGILTDKDLRIRCTAAGLPTDQPVSDIMSGNLVSVSRTTNAFDALMLMSRKHIHHLPVMDDDELLGMITVTDLLRKEGENAVHLTGMILKADSVDTIVESSRLIPQLQVKLVRLGTTAEHVGRGITAITNAITNRLIELAEQKLGPPPVPYVWVAAGSQARQEQSSHSDQDNGLIISDDMQPGDDQWFKDFAQFVSDGLNACGYVYCPGNVMATNDEWRQTKTVWTGYFKKWVNAPEPMALMYSSIFFDLSAVAGETSILTDIRRNMLKKTSHNTLFIAHLVKNALNLRPPLGFFRDFVLVHDGKHNDTLDLKHNGIAPIVDLGRIYALSEGIEAVNTIERLKKAAGTPSLSREGSANLLDAYQFLGMLRIQHQARQIQRGDKPDNYLSPKTLSRLEREHLKDAFKIIQSMQNSLPHV